MCYTIAILYSTGKGVISVAFDKRIIQELQATYEKLLQEGKLLSREQLEQYYTTFRHRFGPDRLKSLDGEVLLETMHGLGTKDSLVYWLEFKNDEEFSSPPLGSIAGGSAHKLGLFRKKETGQWTTGSSQNEQILTLEEAIEIARLHREQLIRGAELLQHLPNNGSDADYEQLQRGMDDVAPDVGNSAWGHKYFSLLYPEKLDDFHSPNYQRFHLIKLLQLPPQGEGRYLAAGRFVALAKSLKIPMNHLTTAINARDGRNLYNYWRIEVENNQVVNSWTAMREGNFVTFGQLEIGDLTNIPHSKAGKEGIQLNLFPSTLPHQNQLLSDDNVISSTSTKKIKVDEIFAFRWRIAINDRVLLCTGATVLGVGQVVGQYSHIPSSTMPHRLPVEWLSLEQWKLSDTEGLQTIVYRMKKDINLLEVEKHIYGKGLPEIETGPKLPVEPERNLAVPPLPPTSERVQDILERKGQVILYGPPGTGKTYWAEKTARELASRANYGTASGNLSDIQRAEITGKDSLSQGFVRLCSFHPAYGYEDFLEGFRPQSVNGQMHFELRDGIFKKLCHDAQMKPDKAFYLIIDEINRGDIPRIFGELLTVMEKNKRGKAILLPLTGEPFYVPQNVYVIGTMNTADRSIALLDAALRRRFGFLELMPDTSVLGDMVIDGIPLAPWLDALNERIFTFIGRDARNLQLGQSYLMEGERPIGDFTTLKRVIQEDIFPLLEEYCYDDYRKLQDILGTELVDEKKQQFRQELFEPENKEQLITALLAIAPEITTSRQAIKSEAEKEELEHDDLDDDALQESGHMVGSEA